MLSLVIPFAAAGVAVVWFLLADGNLVAMAVAALTTGANGAIVTRFCRRSAVGAIPRRALWLRLAFLILPSVAITGLVLGAVEGSPARTVNGLVGGALYAPTALPLLAALLWLALRAERPRHGSIEAGSDLRAMAAVLIAAFALLAARSVGSWRVTPEGEELASSGAYVLACCVALVSLGVLAADVADLRRVARIAQNRALEAHAGDEAAARRIDLGVGDETAAEMARGAAYRSVARHVDVVLGSVPHALRALRLAVARDLAVVVVAGAVVFMHASERTEAARRAQVAFRAGHGFPAACVEQGRWLDAHEGAARREHVTELCDTACKGGLGAACEEAAVRYEADGPLERAARARSRLCDMRAAKACHSAGVLFVRAGAEPALAFDQLLKAACTAGIPEACCEGAYLAHHGEGARYVAMNDFRHPQYLARSQGAHDPAAAARYAGDLYRLALAAGHGEHERCVALRAEGFDDRGERQETPWGSQAR